MVAILNARVKAIMKSGIALSPKFGFQLMAKSDRAIQPTAFSSKPVCQSDFSTPPQYFIIPAKATARFAKRSGIHGRSCLKRSNLLISKSKSSIKRRPLHNVISRSEATRNLKDFSHAFEMTKGNQISHMRSK